MLSNNSKHTINNDYPIFCRGVDFFCLTSHYSKFYFGKKYKLIKKGGGGQIYEFQI